MGKRGDRPPTSYGLVQLCEHLGVPQWRLERAVRMGLVPPADRGPRRWSAPVAEQAHERLAGILAKVGTIPDLGAGRAAEVLTERLGIEVTADAVAELECMGLVAEVAGYKGHPVYCGRALEALADRPGRAAVVEVTRAGRAGRLLTASAAAEYLRIRPSDFAHLVQDRWAEPVTWVRSQWRARSAPPDVPLYWARDLDVLEVHPAIDWDAVRSTPKGRPSALARLTGSAERQPGRKVLAHG